MKWIREPFWRTRAGILFVVIGCSLLIIAFPDKDVKQLDEIRSNAVVCVKPNSASEKAWNCWEENK